MQTYVISVINIIICGNVSSERKPRHEVHGRKEECFLIPVQARSTTFVCLWLVGRGFGSESSCACCVLSGTGLCDGPIPRPEESYRVDVSVCVCVSLSVIGHNNNPLHQY